MLESFFNVNWSEIFIPENSLLEMFVRGTLTYFLLFIFLRFFRKELGAIGITDVLVIVLVADASQNAMAGDYKSITEGAVLVATIGLWDYVLDYLSHKSNFIERILRPPALKLIEDGKLQRRHMRQEMITETELLSQLREQGVERFEDVKVCYLEGDGNISVIQKEKSGDENDQNGSQDQGAAKPAAH